MQKGKAVGVIGGVFVLMAMLMSGCATTETSTQAPHYNYYLAPEIVDSIAAADVDSRGKTYFITSAMQDVSDDDLEFEQVAKYIKYALSQKGYKQVDSKEQADQLIRLAYGVGDPQTTTSTYTAAPGYSYGVGYYRYYVPPQTETKQNTSYTSNIVLAAYDLKTPGKMPQIWKTTLTLTDIMTPPWTTSMFVAGQSISNMIAAAIPYFGTNAGSQTVRVYIDSPTAIEIRK